MTEDDVEEVVNAENLIRNIISEFKELAYVGGYPPDRVISVYLRYKDSRCHNRERLLKLIRSKLRIKDKKLSVWINTNDRKKEEVEIDMENYDLESELLRVIIMSLTNAVSMVKNTFPERVAPVDDLVKKLEEKTRRKDERQDN